MLLTLEFVAQNVRLEDGLQTFGMDSLIERLAKVEQLRDLGQFCRI